MKDQITIVKSELYTDRRIEVELSDGRKFTLFINNNGFPEILSNEPCSIGDFVPNVGYTMPVGHYGHPHED